MPKMMPGSKPSQLAGLGPVEGEAYQRRLRASKRPEDAIRELVVERAGRKWGGTQDAPAGWSKEIEGPGWMGPNGEYWDGQGLPPWSGGARPSRDVDGRTLYYPGGGGAPTTTRGYGQGFSFSPRG